MKLREMDGHTTYLEQLQEDGGQVVLINQFEVPPEDAERFLEVWADDAAFMTRQAVQASVNRLLGDGLAEAGENPEHRRSPLIRLTELGSRKYAAIQKRQAAWINELAAGLKRSELATTARVLQELSNRLDERRGDDHGAP